MKPRIIKAAIALLPLVMMAALSAYQSNKPGNANRTISQAPKNKLQKSLPDAPKAAPETIVVPAVEIPEPPAVEIVDQDTETVDETIDETVVEETKVTKTKTTTETTVKKQTPSKAKVTVSAEANVSAPKDDAFSNIINAPNEPIQPAAAKTTAKSEALNEPTPPSPEESEVLDKLETVESGEALQQQEAPIQISAAKEQAPKELEPAASNESIEEPEIAADDLQNFEEESINTKEASPLEQKALTQTVVVEKQIVEKAPKQKDATFSAKGTFGYVDSAWNNYHPSLANGSYLVGLGVERSDSKPWIYSLSAELLNPTAEQIIIENVRLLQLNASLYYRHIFSESIHFLVGLGLHFADYRVRSLVIDAGLDKTYHTLAEGTAYGVSPAAGVRFRISNRISLDLLGRYHLYFGEQPSDIGGISFTPTLTIDLN